jgi:hypothetical protein
MQKKDAIGFLRVQRVKELTAISDDTQRQSKPSLH